MRKIHLKYYDRGNFGDVLNPYLVNLINPNLNIFHTLGKIPLLMKAGKFLGLIPKENYIFIGSTLHLLDEDSIICGAGFISEEEKCRRKPKKIISVRGLLTRQKFLEAGIDCPKIYGDPALLLPKFYKPKSKKKYELGIIPHYVDRKNIFLKEFLGRGDVKLINVLGNVEDVIEDIFSCKKIASSSLHGLIVADAYGIPSTWLEFSDKVIGRGFKFKDYFLSVGRPIEKSLRFGPDTTLNEILERCKKHKLKLDIEKMLRVCPFKKLSN